MKRIYNFLKSIRLAVVLILFLAIVSLVSTFIPQGEAAAFYTEKYPSVLSFLILTTGFDHFFSSLLFMVPVLLFFINLLLCTIGRLVKEFSSRIKKRFGPDLLHLGILLLIIGGLGSVLLRQEEFAELGVGDSITLQGKYLLTLTRVKELTYPDDRPKDWISVVNITENEISLVSGFSIEVNKPLIFRNITIYQTTFSNAPYLVVTGPAAESYIRNTGNFIRTNNGTILFHGIKQDPVAAGRLLAVFEAQYTDGSMEFLYKTLSDSIGSYTIAELSTRNLSGLKFVADPGLIPVISALVLIGTGICLTFIQKRGMNE